MAVTAVDAGRLDMLHHTHDMEVFSVENGVHFRLLAAVQEMVDQDLVAGNMLEQAHDCRFHFVVIDDDSHTLPTQYIAGADEHRISYPVSHLYGLVDIEGRAIIGIGDAELFQHIAEPAPVFCDIHAVKRGTDDPDPLLMQPFCQLQGRLTTQLYDDAFRLFMLDDFPQVLPVNGLEIELVGNIEVGRNGLRVAVDHDGLVPAFFNGHQPVDTAVIKLDTLPDAVGARSEHDDLLFVAAFAFIGMTAFESGVEIGRFSLELR